MSTRPASRALVGWQRVAGYLSALGRRTASRVSTQPCFNCFDYEGAGRARLLDLVPGRSAVALKTWLADQTPASRDRIDVVAMDGFGGYKTAAAEQATQADLTQPGRHIRG